MTKKKLRTYVMVDITITANTTKMFEGTSDIMFFNAGAAAININAVTLLPGDTLSHPAFGDEINNTQYNISFAAASTLIITQKKYQYHGD